MAQCIKILIVFMLKVPCFSGLKNMVCYNLLRLKRFKGDGGWLFNGPLIVREWAFAEFIREHFVKKVLSLTFYVIFR